MNRKKQTSDKHLMLKILLILTVIMLSTNQTIAKKTEIQISKIYNNVSKNLLSIKKDHPKAQPKVYSLLDQVCKMYKLSKNSIVKKQLLKKKLEERDKIASVLKVENRSLKVNIKDLMSKLNLTKKDLESKTKTINKSNLMLTLANKENESMRVQLQKIQEEQKELILKTSQDRFNNEELSNENSISKNEQVKSVKNGSKQLLQNKSNNLLQSVNLTSTWAPTSPL